MHAGEDGHGIDEARPVRLDFLARRVQEEEQEDRRGDGAKQEQARLAPLPAANKRVKASKDAEAEDQRRGETRRPAQELRDTQKRVCRLVLDAMRGLLEKRGPFVRVIPIEDRRHDGGGNQRTEIGLALANQRRFSGKAAIQMKMPGSSSTAVYCS